MDLDKTSVAIATCVTIGFCALIAMGAVGIVDSNKHYYATASACIAKGGTWVPMNYGTCVAAR